MESSACKIVGHVEYNGEALVQLGFKCLPRRTHPSGTTNSGSQLFLAMSLSPLPRASLASSRSVVRRDTDLSNSISLFRRRLFSTPTQLGLRPFVFRSLVLSSCPCYLFFSALPFHSYLRCSSPSLLLAPFGPV